MSDPSRGASVIVDEIDAGTLRPWLHAAVRALHRSMRLDDDLQQAALAHFDRGASQAEMAETRHALWSRIATVDPKAQGGLRLANCLINEDQEVDWYLAEYLIAWAREQGVSDRAIVHAFHGSVRNL
jgi:hypothetical protein